MGYSCTAAADDTLARITDHCFQQTNSQNCFSDDTGQQYFWEIGRENDTGAITGNVYWISADDTVCRKIGSFKITPNGSIARFSHLRKSGFIF